MSTQADGSKEKERSSMPFDRAHFRALFCAHMQGKSVRTLAEEIGISPSTVSRLANGETPDMDSLAAVIVWMGVSADVFFTRESCEPRNVDEAVVHLGYALYNVQLAEEVCEAVLTLVRYALRREEAKHEEDF